MALAIGFSACLLAGILVGRLLPAHRRVVQLADGFQSLVLYGLMLLMGFRLQSDPEVWRQMGVIGVQALVLTLVATAGSIGLVWVFQSLYLRRRRMDLYGDDALGEEKRSNPLKSLLSILLFIGLGILLGWALEGWPLVTWLRQYNGRLVDVLLCLMMLSSGLAVGQQKSIWKSIRSSGWALVAVPACTLVASIILPALCAPLLGLHPLEAAICGGGCGWYSFTGVLMAEMRPELGALGLISNLLREVVALGITPFVAAKLGPMVAVAPGGATTMDVSLPVVVRSTSAANAILAFSNGLLLSMAIPFVLRFLIALAY